MKQMLLVLLLFSCGFVTASEKEDVSGDVSCFKTMYQQSSQCWGNLSSASKAMLCCGAGYCCFQVSQGRPFEQEVCCRLVGRGCSAFSGHYFGTLINDYLREKED